MVLQHNNCRRVRHRINRSQGATQRPKETWKYPYREHEMDSKAEWLLGTTKGGNSWKHPESTEELIHMGTNVALRASSDTCTSCTWDLLLASVDQLPFDTSMFDLGSTKLEKFYFHELSTCSENTTLGVLFPFLIIKRNNYWNFRISLHLYYKQKPPFLWNLHLHKAPFSMTLTLASSAPIPVSN